MMQKLLNSRFQQLYFFFIFSSVIGWIYEVLLELIEHSHTFVNRGFLFGPWLPVYGFGMLLVVFILKKAHVKKPLTVFVFGTLIVTGVEFITSYLLEAINGPGKFLWDYHDEILNYQGRIALIPDLMFGFLILIGYYWAYPMTKLLFKTRAKWKTAMVIILLVLFVADVLARFKFGSNFIE